MGTRWNPETRQFHQDAAAKEEDLKLKYEMHETTNARMVRICLPAINSVNSDLEFTAEIPEEFPENKLPTLDFFLWLEKSGLLNHSYFQKAMKVPLVTMKASALSDHQRYSILSNELIRRLSNTNPDDQDNTDITRITEVFIQELKNSGYERKCSRETVVSGVLGWKRKLQRRKDEGKPFYRSGRSTLALRCKKKLTEKTTW